MADQAQLSGEPPDTPPANKLSPRITGIDQANTPKERRRIIRNVVIISAAFMVHFTAFQGTGNLQSSINDEGGLGTSALSAIYASLILSNIFLPVVVIRWIGCKWTMAVSFVAYMPYMAAQFYPTWGTLIPAGLLVGLGGGPLWCAKCTYLTVVSREYSRLTDVDPDVLIVRFLGIFFMLFQFSQVWGNLISSTVFSSGHTGSKFNGSVDMGDVCGANYYPPDKSTETNAERPSDEKIYTVAGIYLACMCLAVVIVALFVDSLTRYGDNKREGSGTGLSGIQLLAITLKLLRRPNQLLLLPITFFLGIEQAFVGADFTASFVSCAWGVPYVGYVMICYGLANSASAIGAGWLVKLTGRLPVISAAAALHAGLLIALLLWRPHSDDRVLYFVFSGLWGVCDGVWLVQINAMCGILFPGQEEAAYSNFRLWESLGFIVAYLYSAYMITYVKVYVLLANLALGMALYVWIEVRERRRLVKIAP